MRAKSSVAPSPSLPLRSARTGDRERFAQNVVAGMRLRQAYVDAGFADAVRADGNALRLLRKPDVTARIEHLRKDIAEREGVELWLRRARTVAALESIIGADRAGMYESNGAMKPLDQLTPEQRALIDSIRPTRSGHEALLPSKLAAMQLLAKLEGLEAPTQRDVHVTITDQRYSDVELARWIAARLEDAAESGAVLDLPALPAGDDGAA